MLARTVRVDNLKKLAELHAGNVEAAAEPNPTANPEYSSELGHEGDPGSQSHPPRLRMRLRQQHILPSSSVPTFPLPPMPIHPLHPQFPRAQSHAQILSASRRAKPRGVISTHKLTGPLSKKIAESHTSSSHLSTESEEEPSTARPEAHTQNRALLVTAFDSAKSSLISSSSKVSLQQESRPLDQPLQVIRTSSHLPTLINPNPTHIEQQALIVGPSEMVDEHGSPIGYGPWPRVVEEDDSVEDADDADSVIAQAAYSRASLLNQEERGPNAGRGARTLRGVVDATAELQRLAAASPPTPAIPFQHVSRIRQYHPPQDAELDESPLNTPGTSIILPPRSMTRRPSIDDEQISPAAVVAASTPTRLLTQESIRNIINDEMAQYQADVSARRVSRPGALAALSRASQQVSLTREAGLRTFVRYQVAANAPNISAF
ncbi:hypothetical protein F4677DRAFT_270740 [Hypoxylon crocopeplum]|nr:hypothetical protein F4677DRAFT_270740 [Hypoxylon crocopeplum]